MGCGCGKSKSAERRLEFVVTDTKGVQRTYRTEQEARAAVRRTGGSMQAKTLTGAR